MVLVLLSNTKQYFNTIYDEKSRKNVKFLQSKKAFFFILKLMAEPYPDALAKNRLF